MSKMMGQRIHNKRIEVDMTMEELGKIIGVSRQTICNWENGHVEDIPRKQIAKLSEIFHCKPSWLMGMDDAQRVTLTYLAPDKETIKVVADGDPVIGESSLRAKLYQAALKVRPENIETAIELLKSLS